MKLRRLRLGRLRINWGTSRYVLIVWWDVRPLVRWRRRT